MMIPERMAPMMHPRIPPVAFPIMEAQPFSKKQVTVSGITMVGNIPAVRIMVMVEVIMATIKPMIRAFGAQSKITGQSRAGIAPGTTFSAIPLNAGTISPINIRTPRSITVIPTPK